MPRTYRSSRRRSFRKFRRPIRKRSFSRRRVYGRRRTFTKKRLLWPKSQLVKLRYVDVDTPQLTFNGTSDQQPSHRYNLNSAFDPNGASSSSSIPGFASYAGMYQYYKVMGVRMDCTFFLDDPQYTEPLMVGILMRDFQLGTYTSPQWASMIRGNPNSVTKMLIPAYRTTKVSMYRKMASLLGNPLEYKTNKVYDGTYNTNPPNVLSGYVFASSAKPLGSHYPPTGTVWCKTELTYYIKFWGYKYQTYLPPSQAIQETKIPGVPEGPDEM